MIKKLILLFLTGTFCSPIIGQELQYGVRPFVLIEAMTESPLKSKLLSCKNQLPKKSNFSIAHRGAPL